MTHFPFCEARPSARLGPQRRAPHIPSLLQPSCARKTPLQMNLLTAQPARRTRTFSWRLHGQVTFPYHGVPSAGRRGLASSSNQSQSARSHGQPSWASSPAGVRRRARVRRRGAREQRARSRCSPKTRGAAASSRLSGSGLSRSRAGRRAMCRLVHCDCDARLRSLRAACRRDASRPRRDSDGLAGSKSHISNST